MKSLASFFTALGLALGLALAGVPAAAQQPPPLKPASPAAAAAAKEILAMKNASAMYASAVPNIVQQTKGQLMQSNINYQKDLNEVAVVVAQKLAGREKELPRLRRELKRRNDRVDGGAVLLHQQLDGCVGEHGAARLGAEEVRHILGDGDQAEVVLAGATSHASQERSPLRTLHQRPGLVDDQEARPP